MESGESGTWRDEVERLVRALWRVHRDHPWLGRISLLTRPIPVPNLLAFGDRLLGALEALDLPHKRRFGIHVLLYNHVVGLATNFEEENTAQSETGLSAEEWTDLRFIPTLPGARRAELPHFAAMLDHFATDGGYDMDLDGLFETGLGIMLDGIEALEARSLG